MKSDFQFMLEVIAAVVCGSDLPDADFDINWEKIYNVSRMHNIANIIGYAVMSEKYDMDVRLKQFFTKAVSDDIRLDVIQSQKSAELFERFNQEHIEYMPLKGLNTKKLYPSSDMRRMSDMDILIKEPQREKISSVMEDLGYNF